MLAVSNFYLFVFVTKVQLLSTFVYYWQLVCLFVFSVEEGFATGFHESES